MKTIIVLIVLSLALVACDSPSMSTPTPTTYNVIYKVTGTASKASITYRNAQEGTEQMKIDVPWQKNIGVKEGNFLYISAQNEGMTGSIGCEIWVNGTKWKEATSTGAYVIATCNGSAGRD